MVYIVFIDDEIVGVYKKQEDAMNRAYNINGTYYGYSLN